MRFFFLGLVALVSVMAGCAHQIPRSSPSSQGAPEAVATREEVLELSRRVTTLENWEIRRNLAQDDAAKIGRSAAIAQAPPKSLACVRMPTMLKQSTHYGDFGRLMETVYTSSCLYEVERLVEVQATTSKPVAPIQSPPSKTPPKKK
jgi:uncharacterized small protein (DUF1192 family)